MIETEAERRLGISEQAALHDDDIYIYIYVKTNKATSKFAFVDLFIFEYLLFSFIRLTKKIMNIYIERERII